MSRRYKPSGAIPAPHTGRCAVPHEPSNTHLGEMVFSGPVAAYFFWAPMTSLRISSAVRPDGNPTYAIRCTTASVSSSGVMP